MYRQLRDARAPRRRRLAHSHPEYVEPSLSVFLTPSSVHESPAPAPPWSLVTVPVAVSVSSSGPPCGRKRGRERWDGFDTYECEALTPLS